MKVLLWKNTAVFISFVICFCACSIGGEVVKITTVENGSYGGLKKDELEKIHRIKKNRDEKDINDNLKTVIDKTVHYSVDQYLVEKKQVRGIPDSDYRVGGYDVISITVYEEEDLTRDAVRVSGDGWITFPLISRVRVAHLTTSEIEKLISLKLVEGGFILDAQVSVMVTEYNSKKFLVLGTVNNPGSYPLRGRERVLDAISKAGGVRAELAGKTGMIIRMENPNSVNERKIVININLHDLLSGKNQMSNICLEEKDVLYIPTVEHFYIIGEVRDSGSYALTNREITLVEAISMAGGFTPVAARNSTRIIRVEEGVEKIIEVNVDAITKAGKKIQDVYIQPNDVVVVPQSFF